MKPPLPDPTTPHAYLQRESHSTSKAARDFVLPRTGTQRWKVLVAIAEHGQLMDDELVQIEGTGVKAGVRRQELCEMGWVEWSGEYATTRNNCQAKLWQLTKGSGS